MTKLYIVVGDKVTFGGTDFIYGLYDNEEEARLRKSRIFNHSSQPWAVVMEIEVGQNYNSPQGWPDKLDKWVGYY